MKIRISAFLLALLVVSSSPYAEENESLDDIDFSVLKYKQLKLKKNNRLKFDEHSNKLTILGSPRNYLAFKLPDNIYYTLDLSLNIDGFSKWRTIYPKMIALDDEFNVVGNNIDEGFDFHINPSSFGNGSLDTKQRMSPKARYVIIYADNNTESKFHLTSQQRPQIMMMGNTPVALHNHETITSTFNILEEGKFKLKLQPLFR